MFITSVLSHLGAWDKLTKENEREYLDVLQAIEQLHPVKKIRETRQKTRMVYDAWKLNRGIVNPLHDLGWKQLNSGNTDNHFSRIDAAKGTVAVDVCFQEFTVAESDILIKFPYFTKNSDVRIPILITADKSLAVSMSLDIGPFEKIKDRIIEFDPLLPKCPFILIGISDLFAEMKVLELTSPIDKYLIENVGYSLLEMKFQTERPNYDFKTELSPQAERVAKEICAFANLDRGGYLLIGFDNDGEITGILRTTLDATQLRISQISHNNVSPNPEIQFQVFEHPDDADRCVLVVQVSSIARKPCIANERVYIRTGSEAVAAKPEEIRKLVLGSGA